MVCRYMFVVFLLDLLVNFDLAERTEHWSNSKQTNSNNNNKGFALIMLQITCSV